MLGDAKLAQTFAQELLPEGIYVIGFSYPVVPMGQARIRVQISAGHERARPRAGGGRFTKVGKKLGVVK
jgi:glycine C-acetyltransferase